MLPAQLGRGKRGSYSMVVGSLLPEVLQHVQQDPFWRQDYETLEKLRRPLSDKAAGGEPGKLEWTCHKGKVQVPGLRLFSLDASSPCPGTVGALVRALLLANPHVVAEICQGMKRAAEPFDCDDAKELKNMKPGSTDWLFKFISVQLMEPHTRRDKAHFDDGPSLCHLGITLFGRRILHWWDEDGTHHSKEMVPGTIYMSSPASFKHEVEHTGSDGSALLKDRFEVAIMARSDLFRKSRRKAVPTCMYRALADAVSQSAFRAWRLPTMASS